ncbi:MAG: histidine kinase dimerization/phospho-acceptor domain-containing protein, partial [Cyclobacteriaceae bacterium]
MEIANPYEQKTENERLLHGIIESSINGIMAFKSIRDENGAIVDFRTVALNNVAAAIIQREKPEVLEMTMLEFHPGNQTTGLFELYRECVDRAEPKRIKQYYAEDGMNAWFDISAVPNGDGLVITFADVTEEERIKHQLISYQSQLERSNKELENFVCVASHDLQEPLRKVRSFGDRLTHVLADNRNEEVSDYIHRMQNAAARMQTLIADLLKLSR